MQFLKALFSSVVLVGCLVSACGDDDDHGPGSSGGAPPSSGGTHSGGTSTSSGGMTGGLGGSAGGVAQGGSNTGGLPGGGSGGSAGSADAGSAGTAPSSAGNGGAGASATGGEGGASAGAGASAGNSEAGNGGEGGGEPQPEQPLLPWNVGNSWTYRVTSSGDVSTKVTTIEAREVVGGEGPHREVSAFRVVTLKGTNSNDKTVSYQDEVDDRVIRYRELSYSATSGELKLDEYWDPWKLHVDGTAEHRHTGATWVQTYTEYKLPVNGDPSSAVVSDTWTVLSDDEVIEVPAGEFHTIVFQKTSEDSGSVKTYWYAPGVGKIKEAGSQTEELESYTLVP